MMITAELAALYQRAHAPRPQRVSDGTEPVYASETLRPDLPDLLPDEQAALVEARRKNETGTARRALRRVKVRQADIDDQAPSDRRQENRAVLIDTRTTRGRRDTDLNAAIDFTI